jgi:hypothetical protein
MTNEANKELLGRTDGRTAINYCYALSRGRYDITSLANSL